MISLLHDIYSIKKLAKKWRAEGAGNVLGHYLFMRGVGKINYLYCWHY